MASPPPSRALKLVSDPPPDAFRPDEPRPEEPSDEWIAEQVDRESLHQELIEATFDRADAYGRQGEYERALETLDRATSMAGDLPGAYHAQRARWLRAVR